MPQFDVFRSTRSGMYPLIMDVQADMHGRLATRLVVPLLPRSQYPTPIMTRLTPIAKVRGTEYVAVFPQMAAVPAASLGEVVVSLSAQRATWIAAIDLLATGS